MSRFVQLTPTEVNYLLELVEDLDGDTLYTQVQRGYTVPKLKRILEAPREVKLAYQDVEYLLDLIDDDDLESTEPVRASALKSLLAIQNLQQERFKVRQEIETAREARKALRRQKA